MKLTNLPYRNYFELFGCSQTFSSLGSLTGKLLLIWWCHVSLLFQVSCSFVLTPVHLMEESSLPDVTDWFWWGKTYTCNSVQGHELGGVWWFQLPGRPSSAVSAVPSAGVSRRKMAGILNCTRLQWLWALWVSSLVKAAGHLLIYCSLMGMLWLRGSLLVPGLAMDTLRDSGSTGV